jgi:hypothetical protein
MGYSKLFDSMWSGSLYGQFEASAVFMVLLSLSDQHGNVDMSQEAIAGRTGWPINFIKEGIRQLESPDIRSRTPDADGRRIILLDEHRDWGWMITNYEKYRELERSVERREYLRQAKKKERDARRRQKSTLVNTSTPHMQSRSEQSNLKNATDVAMTREEAMAYFRDRVVPAITHAELRKSLREDVCKAIESIGGWQKLGLKPRDLRGQTEQQFLNAYADLSTTLLVE